MLSDLPNAPSEQFQAVNFSQVRVLLWLRRS